MNLEQLKEYSYSLLEKIWENEYGEHQLMIDYEEDQNKTEKMPRYS